MSRPRLLAALRGYGDAYRDEAATVSRMQEFIEGHDDCFLRSQRAGHITGSAWIVDPSSKLVLLTHHRKLDRWLQLGGHCENETNPLETAMREGVEESGIENLAPVSRTLFDIDIHRIPARGNEPEHFHYDCRYLLRSPAIATLRVTDESHDLQWVGIDELSRYTDEESIHRMAAKHRARFAL